MSRDAPFDPDLKCDNCGGSGAFDFMGDYFCSDCLGSCASCGSVFVYDLKKSKDVQKLCYVCRNEHGIENVC